MRSFVLFVSVFATMVGVESSAASAQQLGPLNSTNVRNRPGIAPNAPGRLPGSASNFQGNYRLGGATGLQNDVRVFNPPSNVTFGRPRPYFGGYYGNYGGSNIAIDNRTQIISNTNSLPAPGSFAPLPNRAESRARDAGFPTNAGLSPARMPRRDDRRPRDLQNQPNAAESAATSHANYVDFRAAFRPGGTDRRQRMPTTSDRTFPVTRRYDFIRIDPRRAE